MLYKNSMRNSEKLILEELKQELNFRERIILKVLKKYVLMIYSKGIIKIRKNKNIRLQA